ncbi:MAG TPA: folate transporter [Ruminococcaceae bacterium]|nr:folate transporter [Oscillospiraceae bacterium]
MRICGTAVAFRCHIQGISLHVAEPFGEEIILKISTRKLVTLALFVALGVIFARFLSFQTPILRIGLAFIPLSLAGIYYGPISGAVVAALVDIFGFVLFPSGAYFPGFTVSAALSGIVLGLLLYKKSPSLWRVIWANAITCFIISGFLSTYWLTFIIPGQTYFILLATRMITQLILFPVQFVVTFAIWKAIDKQHIFRLA